MGSGRRRTCRVELNPGPRKGLRDVHRHPHLGRDAFGNPFAHQGLQLDPEIGSYQNRARQYAPKLKRFMQRDPLTLKTRAGSGYQDGMNLSVYCASSPLANRDPSGQWAGWYQCRWRQSKPCTRCGWDCSGLGIQCELYCTLLQCCSEPTDPCPRVAAGTAPGGPPIKCDCRCTLTFPWVMRGCGNPSNCRGAGSFPPSIRTCRPNAAGGVSCPTAGSVPITAPIPACE